MLVRGIVRIISIIFEFVIEMATYVNFVWGTCNRRLV